MKSPFPGMDPYLESRWSNVHVKLIGDIGEQLQESLPEDLRARPEENILLEEAPEKEMSYRADFAILSLGKRQSFSSASGLAAVAEPLIVEFESTGPMFDRFVQIIDIRAGNKVITVIEVLSPWNKKRGKLNRKYRKKLEDFAAAGVSVVEIDLLRSSRRRLRVTEDEIPADRAAPYFACVQRGWIENEKWEVYSISLKAPIPAVPIPLRKFEPDAVLLLQPLIERIYRAGGHDDINYSIPLYPSLRADDEAWADQLLREAGRRV